jgi:hypothetical protein
MWFVDLFIFILILDNPDQVDDIAMSDSTIIAYIRDSRTAAQSLIVLVYCVNTRVMDAQLFYSAEPARRRLVAFDVAI